MVPCEVFSWTFDYGFVSYVFVKIKSAGFSIFFFQQILINFKRTLIYLFLLVTNMWLVDLESLTSPSTSLLQDEVLFEVELIGKWTLIMGS